MTDLQKAREREMSKQAMREETERLVKEAMERKAGPAMNDGQVHTIGSCDIFPNCEELNGCAERIATSLQPQGSR